MGIMDWLRRKSEQLEANWDDAVRDRCLHYSRIGNVKGLIKELSDNNKIGRICAAGGLMDLGPRASQAVPELIEIVASDHDPDVKLWAAQALVAIGQDAVHPLLLAIISDPLHADEEGQHLMISALREIGPDGVPALVEILRAPDIESRLQIRFALKRLSGQIACALNVSTGHHFLNYSEWIQWFDTKFPSWYRENRNLWKSDPFTKLCKIV